MLSQTMKSIKLYILLTVAMTSIFYTFNPFFMPKYHFYIINLNCDLINTSIHLQIGKSMHEFKCLFNNFKVFRANKFSTQRKHCKYLLVPRIFDIRWYTLMHALMKQNSTHRIGKFVEMERNSKSIQFNWIHRYVVVLCGADSQKHCLT